MKAQYQHNKISVALAVRPNTTGDTTAIQKTIDNCSAKAVYLNTIDLDGEETQVVSIETSKDSNAYAHIALDTFLLTAVSKMYPRDAVIGGRIPVDGTMLNGVVDSRAQTIRQILNGADSAEQTNVVQPTLTSEELLRRSVLANIKERIAAIESYYLATYADVLANPDQYLADHAAELDTLGAVNLEAYQTPFDLPIDRINALEQARKYRAQIELWQEELKLQKIMAKNIRPHEGCLLADVPNPDYVAKSKEVEAAMKANDYSLVVRLGQELLALPATNTISKPLAE